MTAPDISLPPDTTTMGERLYERTEPLGKDDGEHGWAHLLLCQALGMMLDQAAEAFDPPDPLDPGAILLSVDLCPDWALPWLAQFMGVRLPDGVDPELARIMIRDVRGWSRGTPAAMRAAAQTYLTGSGTLYFRERDGSAYRVEVITRASETPDPAAVLASLLRQKPAGLVLDYRTVDMWDYQEQTAEYPGAYTTLASAFSSYYALTNKEPG